MLSLANTDRQKSFLPRQIFPLHFPTRFNLTRARLNMCANDNWKQFLRKFCVRTKWRPSTKDPLMRARVHEFRALQSSAANYNCRVSTISRCRTMEYFHPPARHDFPIIKMAANSIPDLLPPFFIFFSSLLNVVRFVTSNPVANTHIYIYLLFHRNPLKSLQQIRWNFFLVSPIENNGGRRSIDVIT